MKKIRDVARWRVSMGEEVIEKGKNKRNLYMRPNLIFSINVMVII